MLNSQGWHFKLVQWWAVVAVVAGLVGCGLVGNQLLGSPIGFIVGLMFFVYAFLIGLYTYESSYAGVKGVTLFSLGVAVLGLSAWVSALLTEALARFLFDREIGCVVAFGLRFFPVWIILGACIPMSLVAKAFAKLVSVEPAPF